MMVMAAESAGFTEIDKMIDHAIRTIISRNDVLKRIVMEEMLRRTRLKELSELSRKLEKRAYKISHIESEVVREAESIIQEFASSKNVRELLELVSWRLYKLLNTDLETCTPSEFYLLESLRVKEMCNEKPDIAEIYSLARMITPSFRSKVLKVLRKVYRKIREMDKRDVVSDLESSVKNICFRASIAAHLNAELAKKEMEEAYKMLLCE